MTLHGLVLTLAQLAVILTVTMLCGRLARLLRQPTVVGEIAGGLILGPIAMGRVFPNAFHYLFPADRLHPLEVISSIGLVVFLFLAGSEVDINAVRRNRGAALTIPIGNIGLPFVLGAIFSFALYENFTPHTISRFGFLLFIGIAMSITALPVLARIIDERRQTRFALPNEVASTSLVCSAADDLVAWSLLAIAIAIVRHDPNMTIGMTAIRFVLLLAYIALMLQVVRPLMKKLLYFTERRPSTPVMVVGLLAFAYLNSQITEKLQMHAFFGAFLAGICAPLSSRRAAPVEHALRRFASPALRFTLPIFFALTGLRTQAGSLPHNRIDWFLLLLGLAILGKIVGSMVPALFAGMPWRSAFEIGVLMNTRGLVELIALNIGLKAHVLTPQLFTMFILMAVLTTAMTVPLLDLTELGARQRRKAASRSASRGAGVRNPGPSAHQSRQTPPAPLPLRTRALGSPAPQSPSPDLSGNGTHP